MGTVLGTGPRTVPKRRLSMYPSYIDAFKSGYLTEASDKTWRLLESCCLCPRRCRINRLKEERGFCKTGSLAKVYSYMDHHGEEPPISGERGSGTIFFANCTLGCVYCQNYEFSHNGQGKEVTPEELADVMLSLQTKGCHNINFVTPTHVLAQILKSLLIAIPNGLKIPLVYNTSGYELENIVKLIGGIMDIYLPDMRYAEADGAERYSAAADYPENNRKSVKEMHRQVGVPVFNPDGTIKKGLIIRHLVLPNNISGTETTMRFLSEEVSPETYVSLMSQYIPYHRAFEHKEISRRLTEKEYEAAKEAMERFGLHNGWVQESFGLERFAGVHIKSAFHKEK